MKKVALAVAGMILFALGGLAQDNSAAPAPGYTWSPSDLQKLVAPIALYPDPLVSEILPASTFPSQIVMADRYVSDGGDPNQINQQPWDPSIQALAHYPNVLKWMDDNLQWTTQLGEAFQNQQSDLMGAMQTLRSQAQGLGNLPDTPQESVVNQDGNISINPANPDDMYVPYYDPNTIYYDPGIYCTFGIGLPLGPWLGYDWDWGGHHLFYWNGGRPGNWWHESPGWRSHYLAGFHGGAVWHPGGFGVGRNVAWDRGFDTGGRRFAPAIPRGAAPRVGGVRPGVTVIGQSSGERAFSHEAAPREEGAFGGFQSGSEAHAWSSRGESSRASMGSFGGGGAERGGGGGGFGGGGHAGGGGGRR